MDKAPNFECKIDEAIFYLEYAFREARQGRAKEVDEIDKNIHKPGDVIQHYKNASHSLDYAAESLDEAVAEFLKDRKTRKMVKN